MGITRYWYSVLLAPLTRQLQLHYLTDFLNGSLNGSGQKKSARKFSTRRKFLCYYAALFQLTEIF